MTQLYRIDSSTSTMWTGPFQVEGIFGYLFLFVTCSTEIPVFNAKSADPDQMPRSVASDLGLHCLLLSLFGYAR